jgi:hypothetical protein
MPVGEVALASSILVPSCAFQRTTSFCSVAAIREAIHQSISAKRNLLDKGRDFKEKSEKPGENPYGLEPVELMNDD